MAPPTTTLSPVQPELITDQFPRPRSRWVEIATSADHKDVGRFLIAAALGFLFLAVIELLLMRLQLAIPENSFLQPQTFNRLLSVYGATGIFLFAIPLILGLFYFIVPLQIGARTTALPRLGQIAIWLYVAGAASLYASFVFTPPEAGTNPLPPLSELSFAANNGIDVWLAATGMITLGYLLLAINLISTMRNLRAPGLAWRRLPVFSWAAAISAWLLIVIGPVLLAAITMLFVDRNFDGAFFVGEAGGAPLLWQHLNWIFLTGTYMLVIIAALGAIAEIVSTLAGKPLFNRSAVICSLVAIAVIGTLAWIQNMYSAPLGIGWTYYGMAMALLLLIPIGLIVFNLLATMAGGSLRMRSPLLFSLGAISLISLGLTGELVHSLVAAGWQLRDTTDATANTHFVLVGAAVFGGFAALHFWFPKISGRTMGESLARISFWTMLAGTLLTFLPQTLAGMQGQVVDAYKFFDGTDVNGYNLVSTIGAFVLAAGIVATLVNAISSLQNGSEAGHDPWGGSSLEWFTLSPPPVHNFDVVPDVRSAEPMRDIRDAIGRANGGRKASAEQEQPVA